jgi:hypothetical protein
MGGAMLCLSCINSKGAPHSHPCDIVDDNPPPIKTYLLNVLTKEDVNIAKNKYRDGAAMLQTMHNPNYLHMFPSDFDMHTYLKFTKEEQIPILPAACLDFD